MGIELIVDNTRIEFKKELSLKHPDPSDEENRCLPGELRENKFYGFRIKGYVVFPLGQVISLFEDGVSTPLASIQITEQTNFLLGGFIHTRGEYYIRKIRKEKE